MTNERILDSAPSEPSNSSQPGHTGTNVASFPRTKFIKMRTRASFQFSATVGGDIFPSVCLLDQIKNSGAMDSG
jgi:hypothetical protein